MSDSIRNILYMGHNIALLEALFDSSDKPGEYGTVTYLINSEQLYSTLAENNYNQLISEIPLSNDLIDKIARDFPCLKTTYLMPPDASKSTDFYQENASSDKERIMLRAAADLSTDLVYFKDLQSRFLSCNKNFEKFMGCSEQEIVGKTDENFFTKELTLRCQVQDRKVMVKKQIYAGKDYRTSHDGESHFLDIKKAPLVDKEGQVQGLIGVARDITAYHLLQKRLQIADTVFENSKENLLVTDETGNIIAVNKACCNATGFSKEELLQSDLGIFSGSQHENIRTAMKKRNNWQGDFKYRTKNGETHFGWGEVACVEHPEKGSFSYISSWLDLNQSQNVELKIQYLSKYDPLTGAFNRIALFNRLEGTISRAIFNQLTMAVILVDINGFKAINDQYGHHAGDAVLLEIAERFKRCVFEKDTVARFGDDEFVIIIDELANEQDVADVAHNITAQFERNFDIDHLSVHLSATIGIALCPDDGTDVDTLLNNAEKAMQRGKSYYKKGLANENQVTSAKEVKRHNQTANVTAYHFYTKKLTHHSRQQAKFAAELAEALQQDQFELYYQPQYDLTKRQVVAVEALLYWNHPKRGPLHSDNFTSLAEQKGLAVPIGLMMIRKAALQAVIWQNAAINFGRIAISLAEVHLAQFSLIADLHTILLESRCSIACLEFAIDEVVFTSENPVVHENLINLSKMGVALTIDKFGESRPLFRLFEQLTIDKFKISKHFSEGVYVDFINRAIQDGVLVLARSLGVTVVSESLGNKTGGGVALSTKFSPTGQQLHDTALKASEITFYLHCNKRK